MDVIAVCRSKKAMHPKAARVLDRYLYRIGDRTWRGAASMACLKRISKDLRKVASRNMAVALFRSGSGSDAQRPIFVIGSKAAFSDEGVCPAATRDLTHVSAQTATHRSLRAIVEIAALFHDFGKASLLFQKKLRQAMADGAPRADAVRHEVISTLVLDALIPLEAKGGVSIAKSLSEALARPAAFAEAWRYAANRSFEIHKYKNPDFEILPHKTFKDGVDLRGQLLLLVLGHHRLPHSFFEDNLVLACDHVNFDTPLDRKDLEVADGTPFWLEGTFQERLSRALDALTEAADDLPSLDVMGRLPLMMSDHIGSRDKTAGAGQGHIANTLHQDAGGGAADSLTDHVSRVFRNARPMTLGLLRDMGRLPGLDHEAIPGSLLHPLTKGDRFDWQAQVTDAAKELVSNEPGGFFGVLTAGTGSGKTRAAVSLMSAAAMADADEDRRSARLNLALPLRTLARQAGHDYVSDLGLRPEDVATLIGGHQVEENASTDETPGDSVGSETRLDDLFAAQVDTMSDAELSDELTTLGLDLDKRLPAFVERFCESADQNAPKLRRMLSTPVLVSTIDHLMPAASPVRGSYLASMLRTLTADLILDEIDLFSEEDISAIRRLVRVAGLGGRRVLIMSATLTDEVISAFHDTYRQAYSHYARLQAKADHVHFLCASDAPDSIHTSRDHAAIARAHNLCVERTILSLKKAPAIQMAEILTRATDWNHQVEIISSACDRLHARHAVEIDGFQVSAGLIRVTRIRHLQGLALDLPAHGSIHREYCVLHSKMPRLQRELIERTLKSALTRKGDLPNDGLRTFLQDRGVFQRAQAKGVKDIEIIVLASPVIETGNDVDFDWLITDPSSARSIVQASGRVNRHRRWPVTTPNIAILGDPLEARVDGQLSLTGVEKKPKPETGVSESIDLGHDRSTSHLLGHVDAFPIDARLVLEPGVPLADAERQLRGSFLDVSEDDFSRPLFWWSRQVGRRHRFRRQQGERIELFAAVDTADRISWLYFPSRKSSATTRLKISIPGNSQFDGLNLFPENLLNLLSGQKGFGSGRPIKSCSLDILTSQEKLLDDLTLDPVLGLSKARHLNERPVFRALK